MARVGGDEFALLLDACDSARGRVCLYVASNRELAARRSEIGWVSRISAAHEEVRFTLYHMTYRTLDE